jgi:ANTAR domain
MPAEPDADALPQEWAVAITALSATPSKNWVEPFLKLLPVTGMAISTLGTVLASETLCASDEIAGRLDELQFDLGEGPCWDAITWRVPVLQGDLLGRGRRFWPLFSDAVVEDGIQGVFAFPLLIGPMGVGAIDLYTLTPGHLAVGDVFRMQMLAATLTRLILNRAISRAGTPMDSEDDNPYSRRVVHQATGAVIAQLGIPATDALLILQAHAFAAGRPVRAVAENVMARGTVFTRDQDGIEDTHDSSHP